MVIAPLVGITTKIWRLRMRHIQEEINANREFFKKKLAAEASKSDVAKKAKGDPDAGDFLLLDVRDRESFSLGHIKGAWCVPLKEIAELMPGIPNDRDLVTYCWNHH
jgi:predicted sulfurtransferase